MKTHKKYIFFLLTAFMLTFSLSSVDAAPKKTNVVYDPATLERTYHISARDISQSAPYADHILVMDELPYTPFNVLEALTGQGTGRASI